MSLIAHIEKTVFWECDGPNNIDIFERETLMEIWEPVIFETPGQECSGSWRIVIIKVRINDEFYII